MPLKSRTSGYLTGSSHLRKIRRYGRPSLRWILTLVIAGLIAACGESPPEQIAEPAAEPPPPPGHHLNDDYQRAFRPWLDQNEARLRTQSISNLVYRLGLDLTGEQIYRGEITAEFDYLPTPYPITLDFLDGSVQSIHVNGEFLHVFNTGKHISIANRFLKEGRNEIRIRFSSKYSETGEGLYRFVDSSDGRVYLYTHFEPYAANRLAPMFDQPDLRAQWLLKVSAPESWHVISATAEERVEKADGVATWHFPLTPPISTYILPLHAGEYAVWESTAGDIPVRLFARQSLSEYVLADWWLDLTARGMTYFQEYFDEPYPFGKYDQVIVPDFNIGGMENVAAVAYTERYIPRGAPSRERLRGIAGTILHELAHMWFGDLVTIEWWNALWLKESFASVLGPMALVAQTQYEEAWLEFYLDDKQRAYAADDAVTTHPIEMYVSDTKSGDASFDDITYRKGASVLKQLTHYLGEEVFRDSMRQYMDQYAWQAASLPDFMNSLGDVSGLDMQAWSDDWLETSGRNTIQTVYECANGKIQNFRLLQSAPPEHPTLRTHRLQVGLYNYDPDGMQTQRIVAVTVSGVETSVEALNGEACPDLAYPNVGDWAFIKVRLNVSSLTDLLSQIKTIEDDLLRAMIWETLWDEVRDVRLNVSSYIAMVITSIAAEKNPTILASQMNHLRQAARYLHLFGDRTSHLRDKYVLHMEELAWWQLQTSEPGSELEKIWLDAWLALTESDSGQLQIANWLAGTIKPITLSEDQDRRWAALTKLAAHDFSAIDDLLNLERSRDQTDAGSMALLSIQGAWPGVSIKSDLLDKVDNPDSGATSAELKAMIQNMFPASQSAIHSQLADRILNSLPVLDVTRDQDFIDDYVSYVLPALCTPESVEKLAASIRDRGDLGLIATKALKLAHQEDARCVAMANLQVESDPT